MKEKRKMTSHGKKADQYQIGRDETGKKKKKARNGNSRSGNPTTKDTTGLLDF